MSEDRRRFLNEFKARLHLSHSSMAQLLEEYFGGKATISRGYISMMCTGRKPVSGKIYSALREIAGSDVVVRPAPGVQLSQGADVLISERPCSKCRRPFVGVPAARYCGACRKPRPLNPKP